MKAVFFDVDRTLVRGYVAFHAGIFLVKKRLLNPLYFAKEGLRYFILYSIGRFDYRTILDVGTRPYIGMSEEKIVSLSTLVFEQNIRKHIFQEAKNILEEHQKNGYVCVLVSSTIKPLVENLAEFLSIRHIITSEFEIQNGKITGKWKEPLCFGEGKRILVERFANERGIILKDSYAYADSVTDVPLLETVGYPVVVNPGFKMKEIAKKRKWEIVYFRK